MVNPLLCFYLLATFIWKYCPKEIQHEYIKNSQAKVIFSKTSRYILFISDSFISNTGWHLIRNNNNLEYQDKLKEKQGQLCWTPSM